MKGFREGMWLILGAIILLGLSGAPAQANLIVNGSFESGPSFSGGYTTLGAGSTAITGWTVDSGSIDYIGSYWEAAAGSRSIDLDGTSAGTISQLFATEIGKSYSVVFYLAGNPDKRIEKTLDASAATFTVQFTFPGTIGSRTDMQWQREAFNFIANTTMTKLAFSSTTPGAWGAALDDVNVSVPEPGTLLLLGTGLFGLIWGGRKKFRE